MSAANASIDHKSMSMDGIKIISDDEGIIEAYVSGIGNKDSGDDIIVPGAFDKHLKKRVPKGVWSRALQCSKNLNFLNTHLCCSA